MLYIYIYIHNIMICIPKTQNPKYPHEFPWPSGVTVSQVCFPLLSPRLDPTLVAALGLAPRCYRRGWMVYGQSRKKRWMITGDFPWAIYKNHPEWWLRKPMETPNWWNMIWLADIRWMKCHSWQGAKVAQRSDDTFFLRAWTNWVRPAFPT